jgi:hypothetical protein
MRCGSSGEAACNQKLGFEGRFVADRFQPAVRRLEAWISFMDGRGCREVSEQTPTNGSAK